MQIYSTKILIRKKGVKSTTKASDLRNNRNMSK